MAKLDFAQLSRPEAVTEERTFTDPLQPGAELTLRFSARPDYGLQMLAAEKGQEYAQKFALGVAKTPAPFPLGGDVVTISRALCLAIGGLMVLQRGETYNFNEWVACSALMPNAFADVCDWANSLLSRANRETGGAEDPTDPKND